MFRRRQSSTQQEDGQDAPRQGFSLTAAARKIVCRVGSFLAVFLILYLIFWFANALFGWITCYSAPNALRIINFVRDIAIVSVVGLSGLEFVFSNRKKRFWVLIAYFAILTALVIMMVVFNMDTIFFGTNC